MLLPIVSESYELFERRDPLTLYSDPFYPDGEEGQDDERTWGES